MKNKVSLFGKLSRLKKRLADAEWRRYGTLLLMGKFVGVALLLLGAILLRPDLMGFGSFAADPDLKGNDIVNPINTAWTLVAAFWCSACRLDSPCWRPGSAVRAKR